MNTWPAESVTAVMLPRLSRTMLVIADMSDNHFSINLLYGYLVIKFISIFRVIGIPAIATMDIAIKINNLCL